MKTLIDPITQRYSRQGLWSLFLVCAFPLHLWTLIFVFRDMDWVIERTNVWDAIGLGAYGLLFAFLESVIVFAVLIVLGLFAPRQWDADRRIAFLSLLVLIVALWGMFSQLRFLWNLSLPVPLIQFIVGSQHPFRLLYGLYLAVVIPSVVLPVFFFLRSKHAVKWMQELTERLSMLTIFYLLFDVLGLFIIIVRNLN